MNHSTAVSSKWTKTKVLTGSAYLDAHIPTTLRMTEASLRRLLGSFGLAYVKPESGSCGVGVMRVEREAGRWVVRDGIKRFSFGSYRQMYRWLAGRTAGVSYLAQRGIRVLHYRRRPVDFRVMIQKGKKVGWQVTGTAARVAHPRKAVTNGSQGGSIFEASILLRGLTGHESSVRLLREFNGLARATAHRFARSYPRMREFGLDIAVDRKHRTWILEVNTRPDPCPFAKLADSSMLRKIVSFGRGYGRSYNLSCKKARRG
ncbi:YheC/YheD family protein [Cohnella endophytica]|uniref:YheC/YheD family protein n=1 Tax=Cohnella endophytica TaxID=2419778 RepID=A0A494XKG3_9BACL|nr:YheC/YheD family protein [Cohnella endophytica]RKP48033.1 YheC/YheD family protein [Cohnella endophytica]